MNKILITGGSGFMGSDFILFLLQEANFSGTVVNLDALTYAGRLQNLKSVEKDSRYVFVKGNVLNGKLLADLFHQYKFDCVVHFAAETSVDSSLENPQKFFETNIFGLLEVLKVATTNKIRVHFVSTDEVYGDLPMGYYPSEENPYRPTSPYAASKSAGNNICLSFAKSYGLNVTVSQGCNNYGPNQHVEKLIPKVIQNCLMEKAIPIYGMGDKIRDWIFVRDHSRGICCLLNKGMAGETYNLGCGKLLTNFQVVFKVVKEVAKLKKLPLDKLLSSMVYTKGRLVDDGRYGMNLQKIKSLGWSSKVSFEDGIKSTVKSYL